ncbi:MAG: DUF6492 family protein [Pseudomonadota bacterium]
MIQKLELHWGKQVLSHFVRDDPVSDHPVALMVPVAPKDVERARRSIPLMQANLAHPVVRTAVVAPKNEAIETLCADLGVDFIDEHPELLNLAGETETAAMRGWLRQQLLKLAAPEIMDHSDVVVIDSDTYPQRPTAFLTPDGRQILYRGDRNQIPFHAFTEMVIGPCPGGSISFIAHGMLFRADHIDALRAEITRRHGGRWVEAFLRLIADCEQSGTSGQSGIYSEYDLYGHFLLRDADGAFVTRYYANAKLDQDSFLGRIPVPPSKRKFRFVSNHQRGS